jgi:hypothetical protein
VDNALTYTIRRSIDALLDTHPIDTSCRRRLAFGDRESRRPVDRREGETLRRPNRGTELYFALG